MLAIHPNAHTWLSCNFAREPLMYRLFAVRLYDFNMVKICLRDSGLSGIARRRSSLEL
jgi:hypothetical protein